MRKIKPILLIFLFLILYVYVCNVTLLPNNIILFQGEQANINTLWGITVSEKNSKSSGNYEVMQTSTQTSENTTQSINNMSLSLDLFGTIPLKEINVNIIQKTRVVPLGKTIGLRLYTEGVLVVGMSEIEGADNKKHKPYANTGIEEGDTIIAVNNVSISDTKDLINSVNQSNGSAIQIQYKDEKENIQTTSIIPVKTASNEYKLGLWVRDAAEGVGTATFYEPSTRNVCNIRTSNNRCRYGKYN